jgi:hypothetical protein
LGAPLSDAEYAQPLKDTAAKAANQTILMAFPSQRMLVDKTALRRSDP